MARFPRRIIAVVVLLIIFINVWYLSQRPVFDLTLSDEESLAPSDEAAKPAKLDSPVNPRPKTPEKPEPKDRPKAEPKDRPKADDSNKISNARENYNSPTTYDIGVAEIKKVLSKISEIQPGVEALRTYNRDIKGDTELHNAKELPPTSYILGMYLQVSDAERDLLKETHKKMMEQLPTETVPNAFQGRGVVMTGGGKYFPMILTAIRWFREQDKTTPIEVYMKDKSEYEPAICDKLFPKLNAECRVLRDIYGEKLSAKLESPYALKPLAILASRFDDIYFMDADSYPLININTVFDWKVYEEVGLILNSDYWPRYISPKFYDIVDVRLGSRARGDPNSDALLQSDRENAIPGQSTESGQVFVRKSSHIRSLMLAMYYNLFGPDMYFALMMQNGHGEGDKDTYAAAAVICGESYYQTERRPATLGYHTADGYKGYAMIQPDPITDYKIHKEGLRETKEKFFALHANSIKSNPKYMLMGYSEPMRGAPPLREMRVFGDMANIRKELLENVDIELRFFRTMAEVACEWAVKEKYVPRDWEGEDPAKFCSILNEHVKWLSEHPDTAYSSTAPFYIDKAH